ncbi:hypothetical protein D3C71_1807230 [compost metagenome]
MNCVALRVTGAVLPSSVSWPVTSLTLSPVKLNLSDTNLIVGCLAASNRSALCRCLSKGGVPVFTEVVSMVMSTLPVLAARSNSTEPCFLSKRPRLVDAPKWPISNVTKVCVGSMA